MPIKLTTAVNTGTLDTSVLDHVKIMRQIHDGRRNTILLDLEYGTIVDGKWKSGAIAPAADSAFPTTARMEGDEYVTQTTTHKANSGELTYQATKRALYEWLQWNHEALAGTIV